MTWRAAALIVLAWGDGVEVIDGPAGAPMDSPFMAAITSGLAESGWRVASRMATEPMLQAERNRPETP